MRFVPVVFLLALAACNNTSEITRHCIVSTPLTATASGGYSATGTFNVEVFPKLGETCAWLGGHYEQ